MWRDLSSSRPVEVRARFRSPEESAAALAAALERGWVNARCCGEDALSFELDFVQHPVATSIASIVACTIAGVAVGIGFIFFSPGAAQWLPHPWALPLVSALGGTALAASTALVICRSALHEYRDTREMTVVAARVKTDDLESLRELLRRHGALEIRAGRHRETTIETRRAA